MIPGGFHRAAVFFAALAVAAVARAQEGNVPIRNRRDIAFRAPVEGEVAHVLVWWRHAAGRWERAPAESYEWSLEEQTLRVRVRVGEDGLWGFHVQVGDGVSNRTPDPTDRTRPDLEVIVDTEPPSLRVLSPAEETVRMGEPFVLRYVVSDAHGVAAVRLWVREPGEQRWRPVQQAPAQDEVGTFLRYVPEREGRHALLVQAEDRAGNRTVDMEGGGRLQPHVMLDARRDRDPPRIELLSPSEIAQRERRVVVRARVRDESAVDSVRLLFRPEGGGEWFATDAGTPESPDVWRLEFEAPADGRYEVLVEARDQWGNVAPARRDAQVRVWVGVDPRVVQDREAPEVEVVGEREVVQREREVAVRVRARDDTEVAEVRMYARGEGSEEWYPAGVLVRRGEGEWEGRYRAPGDGRYELRFEARDIAGKVGPEGREGHVRVWVGVDPRVVRDREAPEVEVVGETNIVQRERDLALCVRAHDDTAVDRLNVYMRLAGSEQWYLLPDVMSPDQGGIWHGTFRPPAPGDYELRFEARDVAGRVSAASPEVHLRVRVRPPPQVRWLGPEEMTAPGGRVRGPIELVEAEGGEPRVYVSADGGSTWFPVAASALEEGRRAAVEFVLVAPGAYAVRLVPFVEGRVWSPPQAGDPAHVRVHVPAPGEPPPADLAWLSPAGGAEFRVGETIVLRWRGPEDAVVELRREGGDWTTVPVDQPAHGVFLWAAPGPATDALEFRVRAGPRVSAPSAPIRILPAVRPDIAGARRAFELGLRAYWAREYGSAANHFREALRRWPDFSDARRHLGLAYLELGESGKALDEFLRARELCPTDPQAHYDVAYAFALLDMLERAQEALEDLAALSWRDDEELLARMLDLTAAIARRADEQGNVVLAVRACRLFQRLPPRDVPYRSWVRRYLETH